MTKHLKLIISLVSLILIALPLSSKERDVCPMLTFEGEVVKNKTTKQREPSGLGTLLIYNGQKYKSYNDQTLIDTYILKLSGHFNGNHISNASLYLNDAKIYNGEITYNYSYDKKAKRLEINLNLTKGHISVFYGHYRNDNEYSLPVDSTNKVNYTISAIKKNTLPDDYSIRPSKQRLYFSNTVFSPKADKRLAQILKGKIKTNNWVAEATERKWIGKWLNATLLNGSKLSLNDNEITVYGDSTQYNSSRYLVRLADGGYFQYSKGNDYSLIFPNGDKYSGCFKKVPLPVEKGSSYDYNRNDIFDKNDSFTGNRFENYWNLMSTNSSDFELWDGTYTHKSGQTERVKNGQFPDRLLATYISSNGGLPSYSNLTQNAGKLDSKEASNEYTALCNKSFWEYIGKSDISELDKELFKQSAEYNPKFEQYQNALTTARYYAQISIGQNGNYGHFSTNKATFQIPFPSNIENYIPVLYFHNAGDIRTMFPLSSSCKKVRYYEVLGERESEPVIVIDVPSTNLEFLKYLQEAFEANELGLLMIFKPGRIYEIDKYGFKGIITTPVALYLINSKTNTVLYDLSKYIDKDITKYGTIFRQIISKEKEEERQQQIELDSKYHKQAIKKACSWCLGRGYVQGYMSQEQKCPVCHGKGYEYTHYY